MTAVRDFSTVSRNRLDARDLGGNRLNAYNTDVYSEARVYVYVNG